MMRRTPKWTALATLGFVLVASHAMAQGANQTIPDSLYRRAQRLVTEGSATAGRALVDSLVRVTASGTDAHAEALYWRAILAADASSAQQDLLRIIVEHPLSPRAPEALLRLGRAEVERGDRAAARRHLERLVLENPNGPIGADGWYWLGRARLLDNEPVAACEALDSALARFAASDVERRNQATFYANGCRNAVSAAAPRPAPANPPRAATDSHPAAVRYSAQVAAYNTRAGADSLARRLKALGYDARVDSLKLFHVRIGLFAKRADAVAFVAKMKQQGRTAIVVEVGGREP